MVIATVTTETVNVRIVTLSSEWGLPAAHAGVKVSLLILLKPLLQCDVSSGFRNAKHQLLFCTCCR